MAQVYKKFTKQDIETRSIQKLNETESSAISTTLNNFVNYFKLKHLS
jgi:hypothetical protein